MPRKNIMNVKDGMNSVSKKVKNIAGSSTTKLKKQAKIKRKGTMHGAGKINKRAY